jgi:hypothetical protein
MAVVASSRAVGPRYRRPEVAANAGYAPTALPAISAAAPVHGGEALLLHSGGAFWTLVGKQTAAQYQNTVIAAYQNVVDTLHASLPDADALADAAETESAAKVIHDLTRRQMEVGYVNYLSPDEVSPCAIHCFR